MIASSTTSAKPNYPNAQNTAPIRAPYGASARVILGEKGMHKVSDIGRGRRCHACMDGLEIVVSWLCLCGTAAPGCVFRFSQAGHDAAGGGCTPTHATHAHALNSTSAL